MKCPKCKVDVAPTQLRRAGMCKPCERKQGETK